LAKQLIGRQPLLKVLYMSGYTDEALTSHGELRAGFAFLHKPFTAEGLEHKIRGLLD
jgi:two-component system cell cycle sensor histidine kinase/response regulator CckA